MVNQRLKKMIGKKSTGIIVSILTFGVVFGAIFSVSNVTMAADSLPGIVDIRNDITSSDAPYNILEIVPDKNSAEIGFLIEGQEPLQDSTGTTVDWKAYLAEHTEDSDPTVRRNYINSLISYNSDYVSNGQSDTMPMWFSTYTEVSEGTTGANVIYGGMSQEHGYLIANVAGGNITPLGGWNAKFTKGADNITYDDLLAGSKPYYIVEQITPLSTKDDFTTEDEFNNYFSSLATTRGAHYVYTATGSNGFDTIYTYAYSVAELKALYDANLSDTDTDNDDDIDLSQYCLLQFRLLASGDYGDGAPIPYPVVYEINESDFSYLDSYAPYLVKSTAADQQGHTILKPNNNIYYTGGFVSNNWFKRYVLDIDDASCANYHIEVTVATPDEVNAMSAAELDLFDFVYVNSGTSEHGSSTFNYEQNNASKDLTIATTKMLFEKICNNKIPCIIDYALIGNANTDQSNSMVYALACMLMQDDYRAILNTDGTLDVSKITAGSSSSQVSTWYTAITSSSINNYNYVNGNVMVINTTDTANKLTSNFRTAYSTTVVDEAYSAVLEEIETENLYRKADQGAGYGELDTTIYKSSVIRYIINFVGTREVVEKTAVNVLEIQPAVASYGKNDDTNTGGVGTKNELRPTSVRKWMGVDSSVKVNITTMTTTEFIGTIEDLNSTYDMIYIGADFYGLPNQNGATNYRDGNMDGMIYTNVGDLKLVNAQLAGHLDRDYYNNGAYVYKRVDARYSGNDITADKYNNLVDYMKGTYPIVVADALCVDNTTPSEDTLDNCTYLYSFLKENLDEANVFRVSEISNGKNTNFKFYANRGKLSIGTAVLASAESSVTDGTAFVVPGVLDTSDETEGHVTYISKETDGKFYLKYKFTITNDGAVYDSTKYTAALYLDSNSDGKFSEEYEEIPDITLTHVASGRNIDNGQLVAGEQYILTRQVPETYSGLLTWKVEVSQANNPNIRDSITGYTRLNDPNRGTIKIKVLQLYRDNGAALNLQKAIGNTSGADGSNDILETLVWGGTYGGVYYEGITDEYKFEFTSITHKQFNKAFSSGKLNGVDFDLMDYDMLILGFYDSYSVTWGASSSSEDISEDAINGKDGRIGIKEYIDLGKSVLFAHDTTSFTAVPDYTKVRVQDTNQFIYTGSYTANCWAYALNKNIRDMVGLDMYGMSLGTKDGVTYTELKKGIDLSTTTAGQKLMSDLNNTLVDGEHYQVGLKAVAYKPGSNRQNTVPETQAFAYTWMETFDTSSVSSNTYRKNTSGYNSWNADRVNEGQITTYPYYLDDDISIARTHSQYFTLDLNTDDDGDGETDLVVWYTMGGSDYDATSPKDVLNNYYIYNKGNITYTGFGDIDTDTALKNCCTVDEGKLFINTMVAAYNASVKEPDITVYESEDNLTPTTTFYEYGDVDNEVAFRENTQRMYFSVNDTNVIRGTKTATAEYYVALGKTAKNALSSTATTYTTGGKTYSIYRDSNGEPYIKLTDLKTYTTTGTEVNASSLQCGVVYYVDIPTTVFDIGGVQGENVNTFMLGAKTVLRKTGTITGKVTIVETSTTYSKIDFVHVELFPLD